VFVKFFKMAGANLWRYASRTGLTAVGLALAIATVLFVNVVALSFESGTAEVYRYIRTTSAGTADVWITPPAGFQLNPQTGFFRVQGMMPEAIANQIRTVNQNQGLNVLVAELPGGYNPPLTLYGCSECTKVSISPAAATALDVNPGQTIAIGNTPLTVDYIGEVPNLGAGGVVEVPLAIAQTILNAPGQVSWVMLKAHDVYQLRDVLTHKFNGLVTTDPTATDTHKALVAYALEGKFSKADLVDFSVKLAALYFNQATSSLLGWLGRITLGLGFVLMLSAALLSIEERKREFGIFAAVGVSSDVFYLFFLESLLLFVGSTVIGLVLGAGLLWLLTPKLFVWSILLKASVLVICYLPPMVIFGSLVPTQRLLQRSPLELLRSAA
jgi:ABC-type antimicrobial peptide transport system permease subunit